ncbi:MAG: antibiotic biosynthesis monooxygenase [Lewinellaceae bacterium]|nr:antibiotic biosynthesis monooxygenase [Lewinellaceae bacterium]
MLAQTPPPPYYAVVFTSIRSQVDEGYAAMAERMLQLAALQPGYLGVESARDVLGITVSYWESEAAILHWKKAAEHRLAQELGRSDWYAAYVVRVCKVERAYDFTQSIFKP